MVSICRGARFLLPLEKALPSRQPETTADKQATAMMTAGGAPHPTKQIQQGPSFCSSCGKSHRLGTVCSKAMDDAFMDLLAKGTITIAGQRRGNPYRDDSTGRFAATPAAGGGGGGGGGAAPTGASGSGRSGSTLPGAKTSQDAAQRPPSIAHAQTMEHDLGAAHTLETQAPSVSSTSGGASPTSSGALQSTGASAGVRGDAGGGSFGASAGGGTMAGKVNAKPSAPVGGGTMAGKVNAKPAAGGGDAIGDLLGRVAETPAAPSAEPEGPARVFSHQGANAAYHQKRNEAMQSGLPEDQAHAAGMAEGGRVYANAVRELQGQEPMSTGEYRSPSPVKPGAGVSPGVSPGTGGTTQQSGPPSMPGAPAPTGGTTQQSGPPSMPGMPAAPATPAAPKPTAPTPGASPAPVPGGKGKQGSKGNDGLLGSALKPWAGAAGSIGAGMFTPGGTTAATGHAIGGTAHGLLNYKDQEQQKPAAQQRDAQVQRIKGQSGFLNNQANQSMNRLRNFVQNGKR